MDLALALSLIRKIPDYPIPGILFQDITPLLSDASAFAAVIKAMAAPATSATQVAGIEARGFIFASAVAHSLNLGFIPIRKAGKLPYSTISQKYGLEYGSDVLEMHTDAISPGDKVLLIDDVLATGGTIAAAIALIHQLGGQVTHVVALLEISELAGRSTLKQKYPQVEVTALVIE